MAVSRIAELLLKTKAVDEAQIRAAAARQAQQGGRLTRHLVELGYVSEAKVVETLARAMGLERADLASMPRDDAALAKIDGETAERLGLFPCALKDIGRTLLLAMADPTDIETADFLAARTKCRVRPLVAGESEILEAIRKHYGRAPLSEEKPTEAPEAAKAPAPSPLLSPPPKLSRQAAVEAPEAKPTGGAPEPMRTSVVPPVLQATVAAKPPVEELTEADMVSPAESEELAQLRGELAKTTAVLRGVVDLCVAKGYFTEADVKAAVARRSGR